MSIHTGRRFAFLFVLAVVLAAGCGGGSSDSSSTRLSFLVPDASTRVNGAALTSGDASGNTLVYDSVEIVLREVEFEREDGDDESDECDASDGEDDDCEEVEIGPLLVRLTLDGSIQTVVTSDVPEGRYEEVEFELHEVSSDDDQDADFVAEHPEFNHISVRVRGTYNQSTFTFTSDVSAEQELEFEPPLEVAEGEPANVTITVDVNSWFRDGSGTLIDPDTAGDDGPNEDIVEDNIARSFDAFEDDDRDGDDDDDDDQGEDEDGDDGDGDDDHDDDQGEDD